MSNLLDNTIFHQSMMKKRRSSRKGRTRAHPHTEQVPYLGLFCLLAMIFLATSMISFSSEDWPNPHVFPHAQPVHNACGKVGAWLAHHTFRLIGVGCYPLMILLATGAFPRREGSGAIEDQASLAGS